MSLPKPYYQDDSVTIYHGDCREVLPALEKVELVLMDPPYANGTEYLSYEDTSENLDALIAAVMPQVIEKSGVTFVTPGVANMYGYPKPKWTLAWVEPAGAGSGPWGFASWQPILAYGPDPYLAEGLGRRPDTFIRKGILKSARVDHPCPKPEDVWRWLISRGTTSDGAIVLDPFMGSGTTLVAAKYLNRRAIGIELEEEYCEMAAERCQQGTLGL